ncbi:hypothetical protein [Moraxella lacunata]
MIHQGQIAICPYNPKIVINSISCYSIHKPNHPIPHHLYVKTRPNQRHAL